VEVFDNAFLAVYSHDDHLAVPGDWLLSNEYDITVKQFTEHTEVGHCRAKSTASL